MLAIVVLVAMLVPATTVSSGPYLGERPVRFDPPHAAPFQTVQGTGFDCGDDYGPDDLVGVELNDVPSPPTEDEGVSLILRDVAPATGNTASGTFTIPDTSPGEYFVYYLCARDSETRVYRAMPEGGKFYVDPLHPRQTAPPAEPVGPANAGVPLALLLLTALVLAALWRIARAESEGREPSSSVGPPPP